ncbi:MAG TPA: M20/M25/M40 family metallo-hydrolase [Coriobacteriia bacterium]
MDGAAGSRVLDTFLEAVRIDSPSGEEATFARWCVDRLTALGCDVRVDGTAEATDSDVGNVIAELAATAAGATIVLSAHLDTVEPGRGIEPIVEDGVVRSARDTVLGSDDKAGIAVILEALSVLRETGRPHARIRVLLTTGEEVGLRGAHAIDAADCAGDVALVLDAAGEVGGIVIGAPTHCTFTATFHGVAAHAGVHPEKGRSAVLMAARAIALMPIGRLDAQTTSNVGAISGGGATNVVPAECVLRGECRSLDAARVAEVRDAMDAAMRSAAGEAGGSVDVEWKKEYDGYRYGDDDPALAIVEAGVRAAGFEPYLFFTGGGSDANVLTSKGLPAIALSCGMTDVHGTGETIAVAEMEALVRVLVATLDGAVTS